MKPSLQLGMSQQLTLTPQLQQAIRLLQLSTLDLNQEIQSVLESNPMLEEAGENTNNSEQEASENQSSEEKDLLKTMDEALKQEAIPQDLPVDTGWNDVYQTHSSSKPSTSNRDFSDDSSNLENRSSSGESLQEHLFWQLQLSPFSEMDTAIATAIIDSIDTQGFLTASVEEIRASVIGDLSDIEGNLDLDEVEAVLHRIQTFDPPGIAARDLQESLAIQLNQLPEEIPYLAEAKLLVSDHMDLLAQRDLKKMMRVLKFNQQQLQQTIRLIRSLNPRPGSQISDEDPQYIVPDVIIRKMNGRWRVELNAEAVPRVRINDNYATLVKRANNSSDNVFMKNQLQEARWFLKSLQSRNETLLKVASSIVKRQQDFLEYGEEAMRPMVLHDIAEEVEMHESTISRVTTQKYMHTPRGIFELKYFFSSHVSTASGGECSSTAIRALIKKLIAAEKPSKPLSDNKIAQLLAEQGIKVARRTIAKYRESMSIPPSNERKYLTEE